MKKLKKLTERFTEETNKLMDLAVQNCGSEYFMNMYAEEFAITQQTYKLVNTFMELAKSYAEANEELNTKLDAITELLVQKKIES